jgi:hypothetical protein
MKVRHKVYVVIFAAGVAFLMSHAFLAGAASKEDIVHPVRELGNCRNEAECRAFCDRRENAANLRACIAFARTHNLMSKEDADRAEKFVEVAVRGGPGGCKDEPQCVSWCDNPAHLEECLDFSLRSNLLPPEETADAGKVLGALKRGLKTPGGCSRKDECLAYCDNPAHIDECLAFAEGAGLMPPEEIAEAKRIAPFIKRGETPGGCRSKAQCESYCADEVRFDECLAFAGKAGLVTSEEAVLAKRFRGQTPGNCASRNECETFCAKIENRQTCLSFAREHGLISEVEFEQGDALEEFRGCYDEAPGEIRECLLENLGSGMIEKMRSGIVPFDALIGKKIQSARSCVERRLAGGEKADLDHLPSGVVSCLEETHGKGIGQELRREKMSCRRASMLLSSLAQCIEKEKKDRMGKFEKCAAQPCAQMIGCFQSLAKTGEEGEKNELPLEIQSRLDGCIKEFKEAGAAGRLPSFRPEQEVQQSEEYQKQYDEEYKRRYEEEYRRQYEQQLRQFLPPQ